MTIVCEKKSISLILSLYIMIVVFSIFLNINITNLLNIVIVGAIFTYVILQNEKLLIVSAIIFSTLVGVFSKVSSIFQYLPLYIYLLMLMDILIKSKKSKVSFVLKCLLLLSMFFSIIPIILNFEINMFNLMYSFLKRYCFIIIYFYIVNSKLQYKELYKMITHFLTTLLIVNMPIFALQFYNGIDRDFITGMFGNNMTGIVSQLFLIVICIKLKDLYFNKINIINVLMWLVMSIIYFAIAEVKFGFFSISILLLIFFIFISRGISSIIAIALAALIIVGGYNVYMTTYSQQDFLNYKFLERYLVEQNYSGDSVNRISFKSRIDDVVFHNDKIDKLVGKGLGSGNPSDYQLLKGTLYDKYDYLKYHWFLLPYLYLENGIIGIVLFVAIYVFILIKSYVCYVRYKSEQGLLVFLTSIVNLIYLLYNNSILTYTIMTIYWFFFGLISIEHRNKDINESL